MRRITTLVWVSIILTIGIFILAFLSAGKWGLALLTASLLLLWELGRWSRKVWVINITFVLLLITCVIGYWQGIQFVWLAAGLLATLAAWDLILFDWRIKDAQLVVDQTNLENKHLVRLGFSLGLGAILLIAAVYLEIKLSFGLAILLAALAVLGLVQGVSIFKRSTE